MTTLNEITQYLKFAYPDEHFEVIDDKIEGHKIEVLDHAQYFSFEKEGFAFAFTEIHHMIANLRQAGEIPEWWSCDPESKWYRKPEERSVILISHFVYMDISLFKNGVFLVKNKPCKAEFWQESPPMPIKIDE